MIFLARHGQTDFNRPPVRIQGSLDPPINELGRAHAAELAREMAQRGIAALYTSDMLRARQTAAIVGEALGLEPAVDPRLAECGWGAWEGKLVDDIKRDEPERWAAWLRAGESFRFPSAPGKPGESLGEHEARTATALADIEQGPLPALAVCHGGTIRCALASRHPRGLDAYHEFRIPNGGWVVLDPLRAVRA